jgi:hypothetical protein
MSKTQAQKNAQKRYDLKNPKYLYRVSGETLLDIQSIRQNFVSDQSMMEYLVKLGIELHRYKTIMENFD